MKRFLLPLLLLAPSSLFASSLSFPVTYIWHNGVVATTPYYTSDGAYFGPASTNSINDSGYVAGVVSTGPAATWNGVSIKTFAMLPGYIGDTAFGINNEGDLAGVSWTYGSASMEPTAWIGANVIDLGLASGFYEGQADAINDSGRVVGVQFTPSHEEVATLWENGKVTTLAAPFRYSEAIAINDSGVIVGGFNSQPVAWINGVMSALPCSAGGNAYDVNDSDMAVGICGNEAALWDVATGTMTEIAPSALAQSVNNAGVVVGRIGSNTSHPTDSQTFVWSADGGMQILPGFAWSEPFGINDSGYIVGFGQLLPDASNSDSSSNGNAGSNPTPPIVTNPGTDGPPTGTDPAPDIPEPGNLALVGLLALMGYGFLQRFCAMREHRWFSEFNF